MARAVPRQGKAVASATHAAPSAARAVRHSIGTMAIHPPASVPSGSRGLAPRALALPSRNFSAQGKAPAAADPERPWLPPPAPANEGWGAWLGRQAGEISGAMSDTITSRPRNKGP
jgi:hypothetical protein